LSNPQGTAASPVATATVTAVDSDPGFSYDPGEAQPQVGQTATVRVISGVFEEPFTRTNYCGPQAHVCGA
jgi:hypothetical protein